MSKLAKQNDSFRRVACALGKHTLYRGQLVVTRAVNALEPDDPSCCYRVLTVMLASDY